MANSSDCSTIGGVGETSSELSLECSDATFVVVGQKLSNNTPLQNALKCMGGKKFYSDTGFEYMHNMASRETIFILDNFDGSLFQQLNKNRCCIVAPPVIIKCAFNSEPLPLKSRPLYCSSMDNIIVCFSGFKIRDQLARIADLVHRMGGSIRKDFSAKVTHLVANSANGEKYRAAVSLGIHVMSEEWIHRCWESRDDINVSAADEHLMQFKLNPFTFSLLSFYGFSKEETRHMEEVTISNGGTMVDAGSPTTTHLVVNDHVIRSIPFEFSSKTYVVKSEWFWASIQMDACADESMYLFWDTEATPNSQGGKKTPKTLSGGTKTNKRKRLRENLAQLASEGELDAPLYKRCSSGAGRKSLSASFLDATADTSAPLAEVTVRENPVCSPVPVPCPQKEVKLTGRQQTIMELYQTETNYVGILQTILKVFKEEIERFDQPGGPILDAQDCKAIFGGIPPIYDLHVKIRDLLGEITNRWSDDLLVGSVFLRHTDELTKLYPNFINYFEKTKETIIHCDRSKPRFHAFLRLCQSKPECGRQTLTELLIRPIQRLPSITLLLKDILKRTELSDPDHQPLEEAIHALEEVMTHINEDKRKADGHQVMFEILNDIENCPANILSAHRCFIRKVDAVEVTEELCGRGGHVTLFVFSDSLEICKRRPKLLNGKSPGGLVGSRIPAQKPYKHLSLIQFSCVKRIVDICETPDCRNVFALITKKLDEKEKLYAFSIVDQTTDKEDVLTCISKAICTTMCRTDYETLLAAVESQALNLDASELTISNNRTLSRAASKLGKKVSRVFSLNRTPNRMKRAISSVTAMMSPMRRESSVFGLPPPTTPSRGALASACPTATGSCMSDCEEGDKYSDIVDQLSIGTPAMQRRRETLAGINYTLPGGKTPQVNETNEDRLFATPIPVGRRRSPARHTPHRAPIHRDFPSTQSLDFDSSSLLSRSSSIMSCVAKNSELDL